MRSSFGCEMTSIDTHYMLNFKKAKFVRAEAELRQNLEWSDSEGSKCHDLYEETRTANSRVAPVVKRLRVRRKQLTTGISEGRNVETDHQRQLQNIWNWKLKNSKTGLNNVQQTIAKIAGRNKALIQHFQMPDGEKHRLHKELLDPRASANATKSPTSTESDTNQNFRSEHLSMKPELWGPEIDKLSMKLLRSHVESERLDQGHREAQDTMNSWNDSAFHDPNQPAPAHSRSNEKITRTNSCDVFPSEAALHNSKMKLTSHHTPQLAQQHAPQGALLHMAQKTFSETCWRRSVQSSFFRDYGKTLSVFFLKKKGKTKKVVHTGPPEPSKIKERRSGSQRWN